MTDPIDAEPETGHETDGGVAVADQGVVPAGPVSPVAGAPRGPSLTLARLHLRLGSLSLARAELETLAGRDALDEAGLVDLLEARWRTGDLTGAGTIASLLLGDGTDGPLLALVVASEAATARGRPTEARRHASAALAIAGTSIDEVFAGMPRGPVWPGDAMTMDLPAPTLFDEPGERGSLIYQGRHETRVVAVDSGLPGPQAGDGSAEPTTIALWSTDDLPGAGPSDASTGESIEDEPSLPSAEEALAAGRAALASRDMVTAADQLGLAMRLDPLLAQAIVDVVAGVADRRLAFVRGDAYRLLGREREALRSYADAVASPSNTTIAIDATDRTDRATDDESSNHPPEGDSA